MTQLETLFKFYTNKDVAWTSETMSKDLRGHPAAAAKYLSSLESQGFIKQIEKDKFIYRPSQSLDELVARTYELYQSRPVAVIECIYETPNDKLKSFADAFKFKKE